LEGLHVTGDLLLTPPVADLEGADAALVGRAVDEDAAVGRPREGNGLGRRGRELGAGEVDAGRGAGHLPELDVVDEDSRDDLHPVDGTGPSRPPADPVGYPRERDG